MHLQLNGIMPPVATPFENGALALDRFAANIEKWCRTGISGLLVLGSNGEFVYLSDDEKRRLVSAAVEAASPDSAILVGSGCESTRETIRLTKDCARYGAHAALIVTPAYYGGRMKADILMRHFRSVADASPIPILLYNVPKFTHVNLSVETVGVLSEHPNIIGIKDSTGNVAQLGRLISETAEGFKVLVGTAGALYPALTLGCAGGILALANVAPEACVRIQALVNEGLWEKARGLHLKMLPVNQAITATYGIPGLKAALDMCGYFGGEPRPPLQPLTSGEKQRLHGILLKAEVCASTSTA